MLKQMRKKKTQVLKGTLILVIPAFVFFYGWSAVDENQRQATNEFARVKPEGFLARWEAIDRFEMLRAGEALKTRQLMEYQLMGFSQAYQLMQGKPENLFSHAEILREALNQRVIRKKAADLGIVVTEKDAQDRVQDRFTYQGKFNRAAFESDLYRNGVSEAQYVDRVRNQMISERLMESFIATGKLSLFEVWQEYTLYKEKIQIEFVKLDAEKYKESVLPEEDELLGYFRENIEDYRVADQKKYSYIAVTQGMVERDAVVTDDDAKSFYDENKDKLAAFQSGAKTELRHIVLKFPDPEKPAPDDEMNKAISEIADKAKAEGADFAALADELSDEKDQPGGYLGFIGGSLDEGVYGQVFVKRAMELNEEDSIAGPIQTPIGMHVIKFESRKESEVLPYEDVQIQAM